MTTRLVVIGGDAAGMAAASQARRLQGPDELEIVAFELGDHTSYAACGLPYFVADFVTEAQHLVARTPEEFRSRQHIDVRTRHEVLAVDVEAGTVQVRDLEAGTETTERWDRLVIGTGATPLRPPLPGANAEGIHGIQTIADGVALRAAVDERAPRRAVVVGGGYIGLEMAEAMKVRGLDVALVEMADQPMSTLDPDMGALVADALRSVGVDLHLGERVEGFDTDDGRVRAVVTTSGTLPADVVVMGLGVRPNAGLARDAGIAIGPTGGIATDRRMATSVEHVYAAGDCVETFHRVSRRPVSVALGTHANKQGRVAGTNLGGGYATFPGVVGTAVTKVCEHEVARTGLGEAEARDAGFEPAAARIEASTRAHYYPGASPITVKVVAERGTGRLLGGQIVGREGAAKRVDVLAAAIWNEMTASEFSQLDLGYAPPFSPVWDPVLIAARKAAEATA